MDVAVAGVLCLLLLWWCRNDNFGFFSLSFIVVAFDVDFKSLLFVFLSDDVVVSLDDDPLSTKSSVLFEELDTVGVVVLGGDSDICGMRDK